MKRGMKTLIAAVLVCAAGSQIAQGGAFCRQSVGAGKGKRAVAAGKNTGCVKCGG